MHTSSKRQNTFGSIGRAGGRGVAVATLGILAATALGAYAVRSAARTSAPFVLRASPSKRTVTSGSAARYQISVARHGFKRRLGVSASGAPRNGKARLVGGGGSIRTLTVSTTGATPAGRYTLVVRARGGGFTKTIRLALTVIAPKPVAVAISGTVTGLQPGTPQPIDLTLRNPSSHSLSVTGLTVKATTLFAPHASAALPCTLEDFSMQQFSGSYPLGLPASSVRTLSSLGVAAGQRPQVTLLNLPIDQDGCQGASVTLGYAGQGVAQ